MVFPILVKVEFLPKRAWILLFGLSGIQLISSYLGYITGLRDKALSSAPQEVLLTHEKLAQVFMILWLLIFGLQLAMFWLEKTKLKFLNLFLISALLVGQLVVAVRLGQLGGEMVMGG